MRETAEQKRIKKWREREAKELPSYRLVVTKESENHVKVGTDLDQVEELTNLEKVFILKSTLSASTGSASEEFGRMLFSQTAAAYFASGYDKTTELNALRHSTLALAPQDEIEGMLIHRLLALHNQSMHFMAKTAAHGQTVEGVNLNINQSTKLMRLYNETLDALNKHRRKGEQRVTVQHVNVNSGGQAVVAAHVNQEGGGHPKKAKE